MMSTQQTVEVGGTRIHLIKMGEWGRSEAAPQQAPLLLLHGWLHAHHTWASVLPSLATVAPVLAVDLPGSGASDCPAAAYDLDYFVSKLLGLLDAQAVPRVVPVGHGMGASIALALAVAAPDRVEQVVAVSPSIWPARSEYVAAARDLVRPEASLASRLLTRLPGSAGDPLQRCLALQYFIEPPETSSAALERARAGLKTPDRLGAARASLETELDSGLEPRLSGLRCPCTLMWGYNDQVRPLDHAWRLDKLLPEAALRLVPTCGHLPQESRPRSFVAHVVEALQLPEPVPPELDGQPPAWAV